MIDEAGNPVSEALALEWETKENPHYDVLSVFSVGDTGYVVAFGVNRIIGLHICELHNNSLLDNPAPESEAETALNTLRSLVPNMSADRDQSLSHALLDALENLFIENLEPKPFVLENTAGVDGENIPRHESLDDIFSELKGNLPRDAEIQRKLALVRATMHQKDECEEGLREEIKELKNQLALASGESSAK